MKMPFPSTYYSDPNARFTVSSHSEEYGTGIQGYYTNEFAAHAVAKFCRERGDSHVSVEPYSRDKRMADIHPLIVGKLFRKY